MSNALSICAPKQLAKADLKKCVSLLKEGGAVNSLSAAVQLPRAELIAIGRRGLKIVAIGAIKGRRPEYARGIARKSGFNFDESMHELGYVTVSVNHQGFGLSVAIAKNLIAAFEGHPLFATTSNERMKRTLTRMGFIKRGNEWLGQHGDLSLWIRIT